MASRSSSTSRFSTALLRAWQESTPAEEWLNYKTLDLKAECQSFLKLASSRRPHQILLQVRNDPGASFSVIDLVTDDMPFLVNTVRMTLAECGYSIHLLTHPIVQVRRNRHGQLQSTRLASARGALNSPDPQRESWQHVRISRLMDDGEITQLERRLRSAITDVRSVNGDWQGMRLAALNLIETTEQSPPPVAPEVTNETCELLRYMESGYFTLMGFRDSRLRRSRGAPRLEGIEGTAFGVLRRRPRNDDPGPVAADLRHALRQKTPVVISKSTVRSTVHRPGFLDYIGVKRFDKSGKVIGEARFVGLWASRVYTSNPSDVPWIRLKLRQVSAAFPFAGNTYDGHRLRHVLESLPRDELFQASVADLVRCAKAMLLLQTQPRVRVLLRPDEYRRFWSCLVFVPRDHFNTAAQGRIEALLGAAFQTTRPDATVSLTDSPLVLLYALIPADSAVAASVDAAQLERFIAATVVSWADKLQDALQARFEAVRARQLHLRYAERFPASYQQDTPADVALDDIEEMETLDTAPEGMRMRLYRRTGQGRNRANLRIIRRGEVLTISGVLPTLEHFGFGVLEEHPYSLNGEVKPAVTVQDFTVERLDGGAIDVAAVSDHLVDALRAVRVGTIDDDGFNRLIISAGLAAHEAVVLRACCRYLLQTGITFSQQYMERVLGSYPGIAHTLWTLFDLRHNPQLEKNPRTPARAAAAERSVRRALGAVASADEDRILRAFLAVILAIRRTNFYIGAAAGMARAALAFKLDPAKIPGLPLPRPAFEIYVHSPRVEGVHLRMGGIARGGIRWSERPEDFRTEVLGLMKAQNVKNTVIVPVGAKGGFVARRIGTLAGRDERQAEVIECYKTFIRSLLDLTDNVVDGHVVPPAEVKRLDGDDPYLVVAADKGTASFSDIANSISNGYGFWLGDAFASGGSAGYDHKKMGITARGAWECIKRHFREMGRDIQSEPFTVAGIGDMSGDVFGNGMLLSPHIRLQAAFNHQHIFLDPDPDVRRSFAERQRLFRLPRSGWNDYDARCISKGGGVFERSAKQIDLSPQVQSMLDLTQGSIAPNDLIRAILRMRVDLLWNGGIGTYVKASSERHGEIGDRANDSLRVDGREVRALAVGEGGNLGFSQQGRIEYAHSGGRVNADFIDNSAGVNTSDVEVNLKILLDAAPAVARARRNRLLANATDEVADLVLRNNYLQSEAISLLQARAVEDLGEHQQLLRWLERHVDLDRAVENLPSDDEIEERHRQGRGLTRPELAMLLAYGKIALSRALAATDSASDPYFAVELQRYFPAAFRRPFDKRIPKHRLRAQIVNTANTNSIVNRVGPALLMRCTELGRDAADLARAYTIARDAGDLRQLWSDIESLDTRVDANNQYIALNDSGHYLADLTLWLLRNRSDRDISQAVAHLQPALREIAQVIPTVLQGVDRQRFEQRQQRFAAMSLPPHLVQRLAGLEAMRAAPDLATLISGRQRGAHRVAQTHFATGAQLGIDWLHAAIMQLPANDTWQQAARLRLQSAAAAAHLRITSAMLGAESGTRHGAPKATTATDSTLTDRWMLLLRDLRAMRTVDLAALTVAVEAIEGVAAEPAPQLRRQMSKLRSLS